MFSKKHFLALLIFSLSFVCLFLVNQTMVKAEACDSPAATWNRDYFEDPGGGTPLAKLFRCECINESKWESLDYPFTIVKGAVCPKGVCPSGQYNDCIREVDCQEIEGKCYKKNEQPEHMREVRWRCPAGATYTCWVKIKEKNDRMRTKRDPAGGDLTCGFGSTVYAGGGPGRGGPQITTTKVNMGNASGTVVLKWDFYIVPDRLVVKDSAGKLLAVSGAQLTYGQGSLTFDYQPNSKGNYVEVMVISPDWGDSIWDYNISCPGELIKKDPPELVISDCCKQIVPDVGPDGNYSLNHMVQAAINVYECILCIVGALILMMLVFGSFMLLTSAGSDNRVGLGKKIILGAVIGGIIVFFSYLIVNFTVKALGGSFVNPGRMQISSSGSGGGVVSSASPAPLPSAGSNTTANTTGNTTPNTPKSNSSNSSKFENCSSSQQAFYNKVLGFASGKNITGQGDAATFLRSNFSRIICGSCSSGIACYKYFGSSNGNLRCNDFNQQPYINSVTISSGFFQEPSMLKSSSILIHEATHRQDCLSGIFDQPMSSQNNNCVHEQHAFTTMADYLQAYDQRQAADERCSDLGGRGYTTTGSHDGSPRCQAGVNYKKDPKCP